MVLRLLQQFLLCLFDCFDWHLQLSGKIRNFIRPAKGLLVEPFFLTKFEGLVWLHYFHPEERGSEIIIEFLLLLGIENSPRVPSQCRIE